MTKRIVYTRLDGGVSIVCPAPEYVAQFATEADAIAAIRAKDVPADATNVYVGDLTDLPVSRRFRNCWRYTEAMPSKINVDVPLARGQRLQEVREERNKRLLASDGEYLKLQEQGTPAQQESSKVYRQKLRDLPAVESPRIDACGTPEALVAYEPVWPV